MINTTLALPSSPIHLSLSSSSLFSLSFIVSLLIPSAPYSHYHYCCTNLSCRFIRCLSLSPRDPSPPKGTVTVVSEPNWFCLLFWRDQNPLLHVPPLSLISFRKGSIAMPWKRRNSGIFSRRCMLIDPAIRINLKLSSLISTITWMLGLDPWDLQKERQREMRLGVRVGKDLFYPLHLNTW